MCGRYVSPEQSAIERVWHVGRDNSNPFRRRYNVLPTTAVPIIRRAGPGNAPELAEARWGLIPHWWSKPRPPTSTINARSEEAAGKPMWRDAWRRTRCLIPAIGWYEWQERERIDPSTGEVKKYKQPFYLRVADREDPVCFAGLASVWWPRKDEPALSCAILTRAPSPSAALVHDRMPVILDEAAHADWLEPALTDGKRVAAIVREAAIDKVTHRAVSTALNAGKLDDPALTEEVALP